MYFFCFHLTKGERERRGEEKRVDYKRERESLFTFPLKGKKFPKF